MDPKEKFLNQCSDGKNGECAVFERIFQALEQLGEQLVAPAAEESAEQAPKAAVRLSLDYAETSATLKLQHPNLKGAPVSILSFWASQAASAQLPNTIAMGFKPLRDANVNEKDIQAFGLNLQIADFEKERAKGWRTMTFKQERADRLGCLFAEDVKCGDINLRALLSAVRTLVSRINSYHAPLAQVGGSSGKSRAVAAAV